jgi:hypothetical protein
MKKNTENVQFKYKRTKTQTLYTLIKLYTECTQVPGGGERCVRGPAGRDHQGGEPCSQTGKSGILYAIKKACILRLLKEP